MLVTFTKNAGSYRKGATINLSGSHAKLMVALGKAEYGKTKVPVEKKEIPAAPENKVMQASAQTKPKRGGRRKKNEYQTKDMHDKKD